MKKLSLKWKITGAIAALVVIVSIVLLFVLGGKEVSKDKPNNPIKKDTEMLLSFDSYKEITGAQVFLGNDFGETFINTDKEYITEGKGSWLIKPQGDYGKEAYPYFRMNCFNTTIKTNDFGNYDKVMMDIYNASNEEIEVQWDFRAMNVHGSYCGADVMTYVLQPNAWTTCEYRLDGERYAMLYDFSNVTYMKVEFKTRKETKDDTIPALYVDNLRGHISEKERVETNAEIDFEKGVSFENDTDYFFFWNNDSYHENKQPLSRVAYKDTAVKPIKDSFGEYLLMGDATGSNYPATTIEFTKTYEAGKYLSFMMYVEADEEIAAGKMYKVEAKAAGKEKHKILTGNCRFNSWVQVDIQLAADVENITVFANLDSADGNILKDMPTTVYMDYFTIGDELVDHRRPDSYDFAKGITFENAGEEYIFKDIYTGTKSLLLSRVAYADSDIKAKDSSFGKYALHGYTKGGAFPTFDIILDKTYQAGNTLRFMLYVSADKEIAAQNGGMFRVEAKGYAKEQVTGIYQAPGIQYNCWQEVLIKLTHDVDKLSVFANFENAATKNDDSIFGNSEVNFYMDNFLVYNEDDLKPESYDFSKGITFETDAEQYIFKGNSSSKTKLLKLTRVAYADTNIKAYDNSFGAYALKGTTSGAAYPTFTADLDKTYKAGHTLSFWVYIEGDAKVAAAAGGTVNVEVKGSLQDEKSGEYTAVGIKYNCWQEVSIKLTKDMDSMSVFTNFENKDTKQEDSIFGSADVNIYMDNFLIYNEEDLKPDSYDFGKGITFETDREQYIFKGNSSSKTKLLKLTRVAYADTNVTPLNNSFGAYALKGNTSGAAYPTITADLDKTYKAGDTLSFWVYVECDEQIAKAAGSTFKMEVKGYEQSQLAALASEYTIAGLQYNCWQEASVKLTKDVDNIRIFANFENKETKEEDSVLGNAEVNIYMDNFLIYNVKNLKPDNYNFSEGITFENMGEEYLFLGTSDSALKLLKLARVAYSDTQITPQDESFGSYALRGTTNGAVYPTFTVALDKTYKAEDTLSFWAYVGCDSQVAASGTFNMEVKGYLGEQSAGAYAETGLRYNCWQEVSIKLTQDVDNIRVFANFDDKTTKEEDCVLGSADVNIYMDNFCITSPEEEEIIQLPDWTQGVTFEETWHINGIVAGPPSGYTRFHKSELSVQEYSGSKMLAVKGVNLDTDGSTYPNITANFGKVYPAGAMLTFRLYYAGTNNTELVVREYKDGALLATQRLYTEKNFMYEGDKLRTVTLQNDCDSVVMFLTAKSVDSTIYYDDFKVTMPNMLEEGITFEEEWHVNGILAGPPSGYTRFHESQISIVERSGSDMLAVKGVNLDADGSTYPNITIDFGKEYKAGTELSFYTYYSGSNNSSMIIREYKDGNKVGQQDTFIQSQFEYTGAKLKTITLKNNCDSVVIFLTAKSVDDIIYYDDIKLTPVAAVESGLTFEESSHVAYITAGPPSGYTRFHQSQISIVERSGSKMLAVKGVNLDTDGSTYPNITINFGKEYKAGSVLTFYTYYSGSNNTSLIIREYKNGEKVGQQDTYIQSEFEYKGEKLKTITLKNDCDSVVIFLTAKSPESIVYYDDIKITAAGN